MFSPRFQFEDVAKACCDFLTKHLESANVIGIARFAEEIGCTELHQRSREYINTHFSEVRRVYGKHSQVRPNRERTACLTVSFSGASCTFLP